MAKRYEELTPAERAKVEAFRARHRTPEACTEERRGREAVYREFPPAGARTELIGLMATLRRERERQGLSLADVAARSGLDKAYLSRLENGGIPNPTLATVARYAAALSKRLALAVEDLESVP
ncbi:MAG: helix-turn-helix transcriptional regulator [Isosphaeraceae bacterium]|nr:helix-turn-helix transcriptional regulator [Isosphaeraceae bacterium]